MTSVTSPQFRRTALSFTFLLLIGALVGCQSRTVSSTDPAATTSETDEVSLASPVATDTVALEPTSPPGGATKTGTGDVLDEPAEPPVASAARENSTPENTAAEDAGPGPDAAPAAADDQPAPVGEPDEASDPVPAGEPTAAADSEPAAAGDEPAAAAANKKGDPLDDNPFARRIPVPDFPKDATWLNTAGPLHKQDLRGKFVLVDFWTYCCINCLHILPELKKLEHAYPKELVVIGVHSAKFDTEKDTENIKDAILRYEIEHPVINDADHAVWNAFGVNSWPTVILVDPQGSAIWGRSGEITFDEVNEVLNVALPYYREKGLIDETPLRFDLLADRQDPTPLRFPGKVLADAAGERLFITDSNHNRIVITKLDGTLLEIIGRGSMGRDDGAYDEATFDHPQGVALHGSTLYVADTENHLLRKVDLDTKQVTTIAGLGHQSRSAWPGLEGLTRLDPLPERWVGPPKTTGLNSPWALWIHEDALYIAMAGPHQIWKMPLDESEIGPYAGNGREDIVDGPLLPKEPYAQGYSSFAQPSGLTGDDQWLYVADSEGSSIRAVPFDPRQQVRTVVGTSHLPHARLFTFGDQDGDRRKARLQHALGVAYHDGKIYVADTYNNKVKVVDAATGDVQTLAGTGERGRDDEPATFNEPAGIAYADGKLYVADTNNHAIRVVDAETGAVQTLDIPGLDPAERDAPTALQAGLRLVNPNEVKLPAAKVKPSDSGTITLLVSLELPAGWKVNADAPMKYKVEFPEASGPLPRDQAGTKPLDKPTAKFEIPLSVEGTGTDTVQVGFNYFYCREGNEGVCKIGSVLFQVPLELVQDGDISQVKLTHVVKE